MRHARVFLGLALLAAAGGYLTARHANPPGAAPATPPIAARTAPGDPVVREMAEFLAKSPPRTVSTLLGEKPPRPETFDRAAFERAVTDRLHGLEQEFSARYPQSAGGALLARRMALDLLGTPHPEGEPRLEDANRELLADAAASAQDAAAALAQVPQTRENEAERGSLLHLLETLAAADPGAAPFARERLADEVRRLTTGRAENDMGALEYERPFHVRMALGAWARLEPDPGTRQRMVDEAADAFSDDPRTADSIRFTRFEGVKDLIGRKKD